MAELLFTTDAFRSLGRSIPGMPMLLDGGMRLIVAATAISNRDITETRDRWTEWY